MHKTFWGNIEIEKTEIKMISLAYERGKEEIKDFHIEILYKYNILYKKGENINVI
jgi:hypothetical protein